jgi:2-oxo-4-hydroxy-4-carboxy--5-ureidoimidazoline (OHCU) decarboxylase
MLQGLRQDVSRVHGATQIRLADIDNAVGKLHQQVTSERSATYARLAEIDRVVGTLREQLIDERAALSERATKLELLHEHPAVGTLREHVTRECAALNERATKLELLHEHPDVLGVSQVGSRLTSPAVSIVMPTLNRGWVIGAAIRSVQAQAFSDWELIVVDDGSSDDTSELMKALERDQRVRYVMQPHAGQCGARNHGLRLARGSLIAYLDSDNVWYPGYLAAAVAVFSAKPAVDCLYGAMVTDAHWEGEHILFRSFDRERLIAGNYIGMSTFMHRREMIDRYGAFDEELDSLEDWDLILRYTAHAPAYRLPALAVRYRVVDETRVTVTTRQEIAFARIRAKWGQA